MWKGIVVTCLNTWGFSGYSGFLPHQWPHVLTSVPLSCLSIVVKKVRFSLLHVWYYAYSWFGLHWNRYHLRHIHIYNSIYLCDNTIFSNSIHMLGKWFTEVSIYNIFCRKHNKLVCQFSLWGHILSFVNVYISSVHKKRKGHKIALHFHKCLCYNLRYAFVSVIPYTWCFVLT